MDLALRHRSSDAFKGRNPVDGIEFLNCCGVDVAASKPGKAFRSEFSIIAGISKKLLLKRPQRILHRVHLPVQDVPEHAIAEHTAEEILLVECCVHQSGRNMARIKKYIHFLGL